ncbi:MAG: hypothetical protein HQL58_02980 [Magnetococcales bacterium]|nr:hypothetical protein [Magnetococcales bacterium]
MNFSQLAQIERELVDRSFVLHRDIYSMLPGETSENEVAISGFGGYFFLKLGSNAWEKQLTGEMVLTDEAIHRWIQLIVERMNKSKEIGFNLIHMIIPEKQIIFPQFRWGVYHSDINLDRRISKQLVNALSPYARFVYPADLLINYQSECELYFRGDSHWCATGCIIAGLDIINRLLPDKAISLDSVNYINFERNVWAVDLPSNFLPKEKMTLVGLYTAICHEAILIKRPGKTIYDNKLDRITGQHLGNRYVILNENSMTDEEVAIFGDSYAFACGFSDLFAYFFRKTHFFWEKNIDFNYINDNRIKHVVWESCERFLVSIPTL